MADTKISLLPAGTPVQATDKIPVARGAGNAYVPASDFRAAATAIALSTDVSGTLPVANGGTGTTSSTGTGAVVLATAPSVTSLTTNKLLLAGNISAPAWTTSGLRIAGIAATLTDTTSTGTVAAAYTDALGGNTIAASSVTTFTNYVTAYFKEPIAGTNVTFTSKFALGADSLFVGAAGVSLAGSTSGAVKVVAPAVAGTAVITMPGVTGTLTTAATTLTANALLLGNGGTDEKVSTGIMSNGAGEISLGVSATTAGAVNFYGSTSGLTRLKAPAVAVTGDVVLPSVAGTLAILGANTFTGPQFVNSSFQVGTGSGATGLNYYSNGQLNLTSSGVIAWGSTSSLASTPDFFILRAAPATGQLGAADAASPIPQGLRTQGPRPNIDGNVPGVEFSIYAGPSNGLGTPAPVIIKSTLVGTTGSVQQALRSTLTIQNGSVRRDTFTFATLPTNPTQGDECNISNALAPTWGSMLTGGGAIFCGARYNGTTWVAF